MLTTNLQAPAALYGGTYINTNGNTYLVPQNGIVNMPVAIIPTLLQAGWRLVFGQLQDRVLNSVGAAIGSTDKNVATGAFDYQIGANAARVNTFKHKAAVAAGTAPATGTIRTNTTGLWGLIVYYINAAGTIASAWTPTSILASTGGYASEAAALADLNAALALVPAASAVLFYATVQTANSHPFVAGTDAFAGGASGNPAQATHYYEAGASFGASY